jgi:hypothetical protein
MFLFYHELSSCVRAVESGGEVRAQGTCVPGRFQQEEANAEIDVKNVPIAAQSQEAAQRSPAHTAVIDAA